MCSIICKSCNVSISTRTINKLICSLCEGIYHVQCTPISKNMFKNLSANNRKSWICNICAHSFPFNHLMNDDLFVQSALNKDVTTSWLNGNNLLFNPFDLYPDSDDKTQIYLDYDPDLHYYNKTCQSWSNCNSNYLNIEEFNQTVSSPNLFRTFSLCHCNIRSATKNGKSLSNRLYA